jgi:hypothetical protein
MVYNGLKAKKAEVVVAGITGPVKFSVSYDPDDEVAIGHQPTPEDPIPGDFSDWDFCK